MKKNKKFMMLDGFFILKEHHKLFGLLSGKRQIIMRLDTRLLQLFASWSNSLYFTCDF